jgi:hypothetical protein
VARAAIVLSCATARLRTFCEANHYASLVPRTYCRCGNGVRNGGAARTWGAGLPESSRPGETHSTSPRDWANWRQRAHTSIIRVWGFRNGGSGRLNLLLIRRSGLLSAASPKWSSARCSVRSRGPSTLILNQVDIEAHSQV